MARVTAVALWDATSLIADGWDRNRTYLTDVFSTAGKPRRGVILVAIGQPAQPYTEWEEDPPESIVGLAVVSSLAGIAMGKVRANLRPWIVIRPYPLLEAVERATSVASADAGARTRLPWVAQSPEPLVTAAVDEPFGQALLDVLNEHNPEVGAWLESIRRDESGLTPDTQAQSRRETRDAVDLAARLAGIEFPEEDIADPPRTDSATLLESVLRTATSGDLEEDLLPEDLRRFDGQVRAEMASASVAIFRSTKTQLVVYNVNKKPVEEVLGVDLIYWDLINDVFTLLQYKRLERDLSARGLGRYVTQWVYRREAELTKQLGLMPATVSAVSKSSDWRMTATPFWFKFVRGDAAAHQDDKLLKGMYVAADYLRLALMDGSLGTGPKGGFRVDYDNTRYVTRDVFVQLVQRGLIGTTKSQSEYLHRVVQDLSAGGRSVVVAAKAAWTSGDPPTTDAEATPHGSDEDGLLPLELDEVTKDI